MSPAPTTSSAPAPLLARLNHHRGLIFPVPCVALLAVLLDLAYDDDMRAEVDCNVVMTADGRFAEVQATGEAGLLDRRDLDRMLELSAAGIRALFEIQNVALAQSQSSHA